MPIYFMTTALLIVSLVTNLTKVIQMIQQIRDTKEDTTHE